MMSFKDITVIITSFRSGDKIKQCLKSINSEVKVILVENSNNIKFKENIEKEFDNVDCILTGENLGYGSANNIGLSKTLTKYALILNPDARLDSSTLKFFFEATEKISDFSIIAPYNQNENDYYKTSTSTNNKPISVKNVKGFAMFFNMSQFENIGFFDENFFIYFEEIDLCKRLIEAEKKIYLIPNIKIIHEGGQSHDESLNKEMELSRNWHWMWSTAYFHKKYKGFLLTLIIIFPKLFSSIIKIIIYSILFKSEKKEIYYHRFSGLLNSILGKKAWYRPKV